MKQFYNEKEVSELLGVSQGSLRKWRLLGQGPKYRKIGGTVRYPIADVEKYIQECPTGGGLQRASA